MWLVHFSGRLVDCGVCFKLHLYLLLLLVACKGLGGVSSEACNKRDRERERERYAKLQGICVYAGDTCSRIPGRGGGGLGEKVPFFLSI